MPDSWTLDTPDGPYALNPTFTAPKYQPGSVSGPGVLRRDERVTYQRSGDGLPTPGPLTLVGRVWRDDQDHALMLAELNAIRAAVAVCTRVTRTNNAGTYTYDNLAGGATPEITPDGLGGWVVRLDLWPGRAEPSFTPIAGLGAPIWHSETDWSAPITNNWETGWRFRVGAASITAAAVMLYSENGGTETVNMWRVSDQQLLASVEITSDGGWAEAPIKPLVLEAGADYILSRFAPSGTPISENGPRRRVAGDTRPLPFDPGVTLIGQAYNTNTVTGGYPNTSGSMLAGVNFKAVAPSGGYRFIRLNIQAVNGGNLIRINRLRYRTVAGGPDITSEGVPFESDILELSYLSSNLYVDNTAEWLTTGGNTAAWAALDFGGANKKDIVEYEIAIRTQPNRAPRDWTLEGSNDLITWDALHTVTGETGWASNETRVFTIGD